MMDFDSPSISDEELRAQSDLCPEGEHLLKLADITDGTSRSKSDGQEYPWWSLRFEQVLPGGARGGSARFWMSFERPQTIHSFLVQKRRDMLAALKNPEIAGQRMSLDQRTLIGRYIRAKVIHKPNRLDPAKMDTELEEMVAYEDAQNAELSAPEPPQEAGTVQVEPDPPPGETPSFDEIPF